MMAWCTLTLVIGIIIIQVFNSRKYKPFCAEIADDDDDGSRLK
jgi:hypothetical protein